MFSRFSSGLKRIGAALRKTHSLLLEGVRSLFRGPIDASTQNSLEQLLYQADFGVKASKEISQQVLQELRNQKEPSQELCLEILRKEVLGRLPPAIPELLGTQGVQVILIVGVNGQGKTTTIAKLAHHFQSLGKTVLLAAGDTFRAAASEQLGYWAQRLGCEWIHGKPHADPASIAFDACQAALARGIDILLIDTAGRLQNKEGLMAELSKIYKVCRKVIPEAPHETWLVLDATTGQNALEQARIFHEHAPLTGSIITKLDGSAKGGMAVALWSELKLPIPFLGTGEGLTDLERYRPEDYAFALLDSSSE